MKRKCLQLEDSPDLRRRGKNHENVQCMEENTAHRSSEGMSSVLIPEPKHKIFLSHSGSQKEFVDRLCATLETRYDSPFYDRRWTSLLRGEKFLAPMLKAAKECKMAVVVVSDEYFMSMWPMIELNTFAQAITQKTNSKMKILPLFYGLSVDEFRDERKRAKWYEQWEIFAKDDAQGMIKLDAQGLIKVDDWKKALDVLNSFNGIPYNREAKEIVAYENAIVKLISRSIRPDILWDDSHVQGKSSICEVIFKKVQQIGHSHVYNVRVVGMYGVGGIGKTTMCKTLCNELMNEYEGQVCHIEFESKSTSLEGLLDKTLMSLKNSSLEELQQWKVEGKCIEIFRRTVQRKSTFLAIDNVWDDHDSIKQALKFLDCPFHEDSLVMVTSRSQRALELLGIDRDASFEVPDLGLEDAIKLFLFHAAPRQEFTKEEDKRNIKLCVDRCYFRKGDGQDSHFHPLALEALGFMLRRACTTKPSEWVKNLPRVKDFSYLSGGNPVFGILRRSFDILKPDEQSLFMDLALYIPSLSWGISGNCHVDMKWLCLVYKQDEAEMENRLDLLKRTGLLQDVDLESGKFSMHDLYREFAELEVRGKLDESGDVEKRKWAYEENGDMSELGSGHNLKRLAMRSKDPWGDTESRLEEINWQKCSNLVVVKLLGYFRWTGGALNLKPLMCLRCFELCDVFGVERVEGLKGLKYLTYFKWSNSHKSWSKKLQTRMGRFPASLITLEIEDFEVLIGPDVLARCTKLCRLRLYEIQADILDLSSCSSLQSVWLGKSNLRTLSGLTARTACGIKSLQVFHCRELVDIPGLEQLVGLERLKFSHCVSMAALKLDLQNLTKLQVLHIVGEQFSRLCLPPQLRELCLSPEMNCQREVAKVVETLKANGLKQLQVLDLSHNKPRMTGLENVGGWPALRCLNLSYCNKLTGLPDLSESTNLKELDLFGSEVELHHKDFYMLGGLPLLQPVEIGLYGDIMRLDMARRKELYFSDIFNLWLPWEELKEYVWVETDIGSPYRTTGRPEDDEMSLSDSPTGSENDSQV